MRCTSLDIGATFRTNALVCVPGYLRHLHSISPSFDEPFVFLESRFFLDFHSPDSIEKNRSEGMSDAWDFLFKVVLIGGM